MRIDKCWDFKHETEEGITINTNDGARVLFLNIGTMSHLNEVQLTNLVKEHDMQIVSLVEANRMHNKPDATLLKKFVETQTMKKTAECHNNVLACSTHPTGGICVIGIRDIK